MCERDICCVLDYDRVLPTQVIICMLLVRQTTTIANIKKKYDDEK